MCDHIDYPCCGCDPDVLTPEQQEEMERERMEQDADDFYYTDEPDDDEQPVEDDGMTDVEADADTLRMAGWGTDEDYGRYGDDMQEFEDRYCPGDDC